MNHRDTLAYVRGVPYNVFEKEIPHLVRMSGASVILSCEEECSIRLVICVLFFLECTTIHCCKESWPRPGTQTCEESCIQSAFKNDYMAGCTTCVRQNSFVHVMRVFDVSLL